MTISPKTEMYNTYDVFISYRHTERDRAWAKWLLESLETYRVPKTLQAKGFPARMRRAFRDEDELQTSADLNADIQVALKSSKFLVVVCSKDTPSSLWIDKEVETFRKLGRGDRIIPLLVEGEPGESFPPSLRTLKRLAKKEDGTAVETDETIEPVAADVRERKDEKRSTLKRLALIRILSAILGCSFDELRQRERAREARKKRTLYSGIGIVSLLVVSSSLYLWDHNRIKTAYYNTIVYRWGAPEGVGRLSREAVGHREISYRIESRRGKVFKVVSQNSSGLPTCPEMDPYLGIMLQNECQWLPDYRMDGSVEKLSCKDRLGKLMYIEKFDFRTGPGDSNPDTAIVEFSTPGMTPHHQQVSPAPLSYFSTKSSITRHCVVFNRDGFPEKILYQNTYGVPKSDMNGSFGRLLETDDRGLNLKQAEADAEGNPKPAPSGWMWITRSYDRDGNTLEESYLGPEGGPAVCPGGYAIRRFRYDQWGNRTEVSNFGQDGQPTADAEGKYRITYSYDGNGRRIEESYRGRNGEKILGRNGLNGVSYAYDEKGRAIEMAYLDLKGKAINARIKNSICKLKYDTVGNVVEMSFYGLDGQPMLNIDGQSSIRFGYDRNYNMTEVSYRGLEGEPTLSYEGYSTMRNEFDARGKIVEKSYYGPDGKPCISLEGYARETMNYDERGNSIERATFGVKGEMLERIRAIYNEQGLMMEEIAFDEKGNPKVGSMGFARSKRYFNDKGNLMECSYFGLNGELINNNMGFARKVFQYNDQGYKTGVTYMDAKGKVVNIGKINPVLMKVDMLQ